MKKFLIPLSALLLLTSCHGIFDDIYDEAPSDDAFAEGFFAGDTPNHIVLKVDATSYQEWVYVDLQRETLTRFDIPTEPVDETWDGKSGITYQLIEGERFTPLNTVHTAPQQEPEHWDFALHHFDVRTNGGMVAVAPSDNFADATAESAVGLTFTPDEWSDNQVIVDMREMMGYKIGYQNSLVNRLWSGWAEMDFSTPPPVYHVSGHCYIVRLADGSLAAIKMRSYMSDAGSKGYLTIDVKYPL